MSHSDFSGLHLKAGQIRIAYLLLDMILPRNIEITLGNSQFKQLSNLSVKSNFESTSLLIYTYFLYFLTFSGCTFAENIQCSFAIMLNVWLKMISGCLCQRKSDRANVVAIKLIKQTEKLYNILIYGSSYYICLSRKCALKQKLCQSANLKILFGGVDSLYIMSSNYVKLRTR